MAARIIDGKALAAQIRQRVTADVQAIKALNRTVHLAAVLVGRSPAAQVYADNQARTFAQAGVDYHLHELSENITQGELDAVLAGLAKDPRVTGIMVHLPLPPHLNTQQTQYHIDILKDVEGVNPANIGNVLYGHPIIAPCTALAAVALIDTTGVPLQGADVTVVGASRIAGRPAALLLTERGSTVTVCHIHTRDLPAHTRRAEILVVAVGKPGLITKQHVRPGAVVIDIGINRITTTDAAGHVVSKTAGDVDFSAVADVASWITPVPGGVGPVTVAMLLKNTVRAARLVHGLDQPF
jgi:methylenetetrahydrofolate dehydrogenase (NADP+)/methenyltetrahydrofolate cyclohydrolase